MAGDRISEAYLGQLSERMKHNSRERINWILNRISGNNVLDVGCSQGIIEYSVENVKKILGIDNNPEAIEYAKKILKGRKNTDCEVAFITGDFLAYDFGEVIFDCIIMCEVLEHLYSPELFIEKAYSLLNGGQFIVTVPFGINRHPDHKQTFYADEIVDMIADRFYIREIAFVGNCIAIDAQKTAKPGKYISDKALSRIQNKAYYRKEDEYLERIGAGVTHISNLKNEKEVLKEKYDAIRNEAKDYKKVLKDYRSTIDECRDATKNKDKAYSLLQKQYEKYKDTTDKTIIKLKNENESLKAQANGMRSLINENDKKKKDLERRLQATQTYSERRVEFIKNSDSTFYSSVKSILSQIPESNEGRYYRKSDKRIGIIADEFLYDSWKDAADFIYISPENWAEVIDSTDFLVVASTWRGIDKAWEGVAYEGGPQRDILINIIRAYKARNKTTVFYSKEDPPNYDCFVAFARECDYIYTTCEEIVERYRIDCNNDRIYVLPFGINPLFHNPVGMHNAFRRNEIIFSGSWMNKYPSRQTDLQMLLDGAVESGKPLHIIDRNYDMEYDNYLFPERFWRYISPSVKHDDLQKLHKLFDWAIDINSINESNTMFANRGYELLASGNILISNYSIGVNNKLPWIYTASSEKEIADTINSSEKEERYKWQIDGIRSVMTGETCFDRVCQVLNGIGLDTTVTTRSVLVVADSIDDRLKLQFDMQSYENRALASEKELTEDLYGQYDIIACWKKGKEYYPYYLEDMVNAFKYTSASYVTKDAYFDQNVLVEGREHDYVGILKAKHRTVFWREDYSYREFCLIEDEQDLENGYSIDHFNYVESRSLLKTKDHYPKLSVVTYIPEHTDSLNGKLLRSISGHILNDDCELLILSDDDRKTISSKNYTYGMMNITYIDGKSLNDAIHKICRNIMGTYVMTVSPYNEINVERCLSLISNDLDIVSGCVCTVNPTSQSGEKRVTYENVTKNRHGSDLIMKAEIFNNMIAENRVRIDNGDFVIQIPEGTCIRYSDSVILKDYCSNRRLLDVMYYGKFRWIENDKFRDAWASLICEASKSIQKNDDKHIDWNAFFEEVAVRAGDTKTIKQQKHTIDYQNRTLSAQSETIAILNERVSHFERSYSYKLGLILTYIPRKIVHLVRG